MIYDFKKYIDTDDKLLVSKDANDKKEMYKLLDQIICEKASKDLVELF